MSTNAVGIASAAVVVITFAILFINLRVRRLQMKQRELENKVKVQSEKMKMEHLKAEIEISRAMVEGQNMEQKRISEDLHDGLGQTLTAANFNVMAMESDLTDLDPKNKERLQNLRMLLTNAINEVRSISHNLMPNLMAEEGLEAALTDLCGRIMHTSKLQIILRIQEMPVKMNDHIEISFYRIVQEIINNTLKHAGAKSLFISIVYNKGMLQLETEDNGVGFDAAIPSRKGIGLKNIAIRVGMMNGAYRINSVPGQGTTIHIEIPAEEV